MTKYLNSELCIKENFIYVQENNIAIYEQKQWKHLYSWDKLRLLILIEIVFWLQ